MRVAVIGGTGLVGGHAVRALRDAGHEPVVLARSLGFDALTGAGLEAGLAGVEAVIDATTTAAATADEAIAFFRTTTGNLLAAEELAGVAHHVVLSICAVDKVPGQPHYAGKLAQEQAALAGAVPSTVARVTQFHEFAGQVLRWSSQDGRAVVAPALVQPVAAADVGAWLAEIALGPALGRAQDLAGPWTEDLVDMARRTIAVTGERVRIVPGWDGMLGLAMSGNVLLAEDGARIAATSFDDWLAALADTGPA